MKETGEILEVLIKLADECLFPILFLTAGGNSGKPYCGKSYPCEISYSGRTFTCPFYKVRMAIEENCPYLLNLPKILFPEGHTMKELETAVRFEILALASVSAIFLRFGENIPKIDRFLIEQRTQQTKDSDYYCGIVDDLDKTMGRHFYNTLDRHLKEWGLPTEEMLIWIGIILSGFKIEDLPLPENEKEKQELFQEIEEYLRSQRAD